MIISKIVKSIFRGGPGSGIMITYFLLSVFGYLMGVKHGSEINIPILLFLGVSTVMTLGATNILDDYFDYKNGIDKEGDANSSTRIHLIIHRVTSPKNVLILGISLLTVPLLFLIYVTLYMNRYYAILFAIASLIILIEYAGPPLKYRYSYLGEVGVFLSVILVISGSYYVASGVFDQKSIILSIAPSLIIADLAFLGNTRDISTDILKGIKTISTQLGERKSAIIYLFIFVTSYILTFDLIYSDILPSMSYIAFLTLPFLIYHSLKFIERGVPPDAEKTGGIVSMAYMVLISLSII